MKLSIPKPVVEHDVTEVVPFPEDRNPDYTNEGGYPEGPRQQQLPALLTSPISSENTGLDNEIRRLYIDDCRSEGLQPGAIVVHVRVPLIGRLEPNRWGIIVEYAEIVKGSVWKPLRIRWLNGSYEDCHSAEVKLLISVPDKQILQARATRNNVPNPL